MGPPSIMGWRWELLETKDGALVHPGLGPSEDYTAWLSTSIMVPKAWSVASTSFSFRIWFEEWSEGWRKGCRNCEV